MRISFFLTIVFFLFSFQKLEAQSKPDFLFLIDGTVERVVIRGKNNSRKLIQYTRWNGNKEKIESTDFASIHKIVYSYGTEEVFNASSSDSESDSDEDILDILFGGVDGVEEEEELAVPDVENSLLLLTDETKTDLVDFSWTANRLKLLRPKRYKRTRRRSRYNSAYQAIPQWEEIELTYVKGIVLPGKVRLHIISDEMETINDSTGWIELRNGLKYAAQNIEIRDQKVSFEEYYTKKLFQWNASDVNFLVWENKKGGIDFLKPGESSMEGEEGDQGLDGDSYDTGNGSRGVDDDGDSNNEGVIENGGGGNGSQGSGGLGNRTNPDLAAFKFEGKPSEFSPIGFPILEPSSILRMRINPTTSSTNSLFSKGNAANEIGEVKERLAYLFGEKNYQELRYFPIDGGFIMLCPIEKYNSDGSTASFYQRFNVRLKSERRNNFEDAIKNITFLSSGYYRMFAVAVTDVSKPYGNNPSSNVKGASNINSPTAATPINSKHKITFMVYEWVQVEEGKKATLKERGSNSFSAYNHLSFAGILEKINE
ncbi:MAG: hypothetical protein MRZ79_03505 [Bacteroidia bacterium]|nr:hypothetical protein [Bacteroidia bacterium]